MPRGDGTGPAGFGPATGRGRGYCTGYDGPGFMNYGFRCRDRFLGRRFGRRRFGGYGLRTDYGLDVTEEEEKDILKEEKKEIERELKEIEARLSKLNDKK